MSIVCIEKLAAPAPPPCLINKHRGCLIFEHPRTTSPENFVEPSGTPLAISVCGRSRRSGMKFKLVVVGAVVIFLSGCGVSPKVDPMAGISSSSGAATVNGALRACTSAQEADNYQIVQVCRNGTGTVFQCSQLLEGFAAKYPGLDCKSTRPNMLAPGYPYEISTQFVLQYSASMNNAGWL